MTVKKERLDKMIHQLKQERDELKVKLHLGKEDLKDEWDELRVKLDRLSEDYAPLKRAVGETADDVWASLTLVAGEIRDGFHRIRKSL
jgi:hypothetical protein